MTAIKFRQGERSEPVQAVTRRLGLARPHDKRSQSKHIRTEVKMKSAELLHIFSDTPTNIRQNSCSL